MAFKKRIDLATGSSAEYFRIESFRVERRAREASAIMCAYMDAATAQKEGALAATPQTIKVRLYGEAFDRYFSKAAKEKAKADGLSIDAEAIFYRAAKAKLVVSDFGSGVFLDAADA